MISDNEKKAIEYFKSKYNQDYDTVRIGHDKYRAQHESTFTNGKKSYSLYVWCAGGYSLRQDVDLFSRYNEE